MPRRYGAAHDRSIDCEQRGYDLWRYCFGVAPAGGARWGRESLLGPWAKKGAQVGSFGVLDPSYSGANHRIRDGQQLLVLIV